MTLADAECDKAYIIKAIETYEDEEMESFLFSLGCYAGQQVTIISNLDKSYVINVKDSRYNIDEELARAIYI